MLRHGAIASRDRSGLVAAIRLGQEAGDQSVPVAGSL